MKSLVIGGTGFIGPHVSEPVPEEEALRRTIEWERTHPPPIDEAKFDYAAEDAALSA